MLNLREPKYKYLDRSKDITEEEAKWEIERENIKRRKKIQDEYSELTTVPMDKLSMSKKALIYLFISCTIIEIFTGWVTVQSINLAYAMGMMPDFTPLITLIGVVVGEVIALGAYFVKSAKENTRGGITYESAAARNFQTDWDSNAVG